MSLRNIFDKLERQCDKFDHYFPLYEKWFGKFVGKSPKILEIGVEYGGSAEMWAKYFGSGTMVHGVDIQPKCEETDYLKLTIGDQGSAAFWKSYLQQHPDGFDIIIDDGSHDNPHQILTLVMVYKSVRAGGIYWCEDTHTSYYYQVRVNDGGYQNPRSFTEFSKRLIDVANAHNTYFAIGVGPTPNGPHVDPQLVEMFPDIKGIHFYDSVIAIEKQPDFEFNRVIHQSPNI
jgi:hypothetical protein